MRLAFRELGLALGLSGVDLLRQLVEADRKGIFARGELRARIQSLAPKAALGSAIVSLWLEPGHQRTSAWSEHRDINEVMLATSLVPEGFLLLAPATYKPKG